MNLAQHSTNHSKLEQRMSQIKHKILVLSGEKKRFIFLKIKKNITKKIDTAIDDDDDDHDDDDAHDDDCCVKGKGGVGKSTVTCQLAFALAHRGLRVGVLDVDICGPSVPKIFGIEKRDVFQCSEGWIPVDVEAFEDKRLVCMSIGFLLKNPDDAVVWRGPRKHSMIKQFLEDVYWGELDVLIIDTPPGTSDEHISLCEILQQNVELDGAVLVTTPQGVSVSDVRKELSFCRKLQIPVLGIVENMSGYACPCCKEITYIFGKGGGETMANQCNIPFLGSIPIDPRLTESEEEGRDFLKHYPDSSASDSLRSIVAQLWSGCEQRALDKANRHNALTAQ